MSSTGSRKKRDSDARKKEAKAHAQRVLEQQRKQKNDGSKFQADVHFRASVPGVPGDPKFRTFLQPDARFSRYHSTKAERERPLQLLPEADMGVTGDVLALPPPVQASSLPPVADEDEALFLPEVLRAIHAELKNKAGGGGGDARGGGAAGSTSKGQGPAGPRSIQELRPQVSWLRPTSYMSNDLMTKVHDFKTEAQVQAEANVVLKKKLDAHVVRDVETKISDEFARVNDPRAKLAHPRDASATVVSVMPLLPDLPLMGGQFVQVAFDEYPALTEGNTGSKKRARAETAVVCNARRAPETGVMIASMYMAPEDAAPPQADGETLAYQYQRDYVLSKHDERHCVFFLSEDDGQATYQDIGSRVALKKRKVRAGDDRAAEEVEMQRCAPDDPELMALRRMVFDPENLLQEEEFLAASQAPVAVAAAAAAPAAVAADADGGGDEARAAERDMFGSDSDSDL